MHITTHLSTDMGRLINKQLAGCEQNLTSVLCEHDNTGTATAVCAGYVTLPCDRAASDSDAIVLGTGIAGEQIEQRPSSHMGKQATPTYCYWRPRAR